MPSTEDNLALVMSAIKHSFTKIQPDFDKVARDVNIPADSKNPVNAAFVLPVPTLLAAAN